MPDPNDDPFDAKRSAMREELFAKLLLLGGFIDGPDTYKRTMWAALPEVALERGAYMLSCRIEADAPSCG